jgi:membrane protease YdiL (CAAX protease family)
MPDGPPQTLPPQALASRIPASWLLVLLPLVAFLELARWTHHTFFGPVGVMASAGIAWWLEGGRETGLSGLGLALPGSWLRVAIEGAVLAIAAGVVLALVGGIITANFGAPDLRPFLSMREHPAELAGWIAIAWTTAAFGEEIVFRGYLLPHMSPVRRVGRAGWAVGIVLSSALFGLAHSYQGAGGGIASGVVGAVFATGLVIGRRSLWRTIIAHGLFDTVSLILLFLTLRQASH